MKVHLIDGTYELFRAYFAMPGRAAPDGREVGAVRGLMRTLIPLVRDEASHVAIAFDTIIESFRNELFDGYKTGEGIEEGLLSQFPLAEEAAEALGFVVWRMREFEADDALAAGAAKYAAEDEVEQVLLCSPDKDLAQCVGGKVVCLDRKKKVVLDADAVVEKYGVAPGSIPDWLALVGDSADGIPGIPRWGKKSAATVLGRYPKIEDIPDDPESWDVKVRGAKSLASELAARREDAELYRRLATLRTDVPLSESLAELEWTRPDMERLTAFCERIGDKALPGRVPEHHAEA